MLNRRSQERWTKCPQLLEETAAANVNPLKPVELVEVDINTIVPEQPKMRLNAPMVTEELVATSHPDHHMTQCNGLTTTNDDGEPAIIVLALCTWLRSIHLRQPTIAPICIGTACDGTGAAYSSFDRTATAYDSAHLLLT